MMGKELPAVAFYCCQWAGPGPPVSVRVPFTIANWNPGEGTTGFGQDPSCSTRSQARPRRSSPLGHLGFRNQEGRADADHVSMEAADTDEEAFLLGRFEKGARFFWRGFLGSWVEYDFERLHESHAASLTNPAVLVL